MKILILNWRDVRHPKSGGAELVTMEHAKSWIAAGHSVTWLTAGYPGAPRENIVDGVHFVRRWGSLSIYIFAPLYLIVHARFIDVIVDEVHGFPFFSPLFTRKPVVVFIHEIAGEIWDYMFPFPKNMIGKLLERWYFLLYRRSLFWTDAPSTVRELVERGIPEAQCTAIPCPVVADTSIKKNYQKEKNPTYIFVSRVVRMKGVEEIIKAFSLIIRNEPSAQLWIVGAGSISYITELRKMIAEYKVDKSVTFFGHVTDLKKMELMGRSHLLLHASVKEGWGLVVLEAALVGTPAVVYNVAGLRDVVLHNKTGIVLRDNSPMAMAKEVLSLHYDAMRYKNFQKQARSWVNSLTWDDVGRRSLTLLNSASML